MCVRLYVRVCVRVSMAVTSMRRRSGARTLGCEVQHHVGQVGAVPRSTWERTCSVWEDGLVWQRGQQASNNTVEATIRTTLIRGIEPHDTTRRHTRRTPQVDPHLSRFATFAAGLRASHSRSPNNHIHIHIINHQYPHQAHCHYKIPTAATAAPPFMVCVGRGLSCRLQGLLSATPHSPNAISSRLNHTAHLYTHIEHIPVNNCVTQRGDCHLHCACATRVV